jgi:plasmid stability protein
MADLLVSGVDAGVLERLARLAHSHGRTPAAEAKEILTLAVGPASSQSWAAVDAIRTRLAANGKPFSDSTELLREDRER